MTTERGSVPCGRIAVLVRVRWKNINIFLFTLNNPKTNREIKDYKN